MAISEIASLLFTRPQRIRHPSAGRVIRFDIPDLDPRFTSGPVQKRVLRYLSEYTRPVTVSHLAQAVGTRNERVMVTLRHLLADNKVQAIEIDSGTTEYVLNS